jgi:uncharacterized protein YwbE
MMEEIRLHDVVALLVDQPEQGLRRGEVGTVIDVLTQNEHHPAGYIVEFVNEETGEVYAQADIIDATQVVRLYFRREAA